MKREVELALQEPKRPKTGGLLLIKFKKLSLLKML